MNDSVEDEQSPDIRPQPAEAREMGKGATFTLLCVFLLVFILGIFYQTTFSMVSTWFRAETYTHGILILPIVVWLMWRKRYVLSQYQTQPSYVALIPLSMAGLLWMLGYLVDVLVVQQLALVAMLVFGFLVVMGLNLFKALLFPLLFLFFAVPMGEGLVPPMMEYTATATVALIKLTGIPVYRDGMFISLPSGDWSVVEACSGVRYLISSLTLGTLFAYINYTSYKKRLAFIIVAILVPIIANGLRAYMVVMIGHLSDMELAVGVDHLIYGWVFFGLVMLILFSIGSRWRDPDEIGLLEPDLGELGDEQNNQYSDQKGSSGFAPALMVTLVSISLWPAWVYALNHFQHIDTYGEITAPQGHQHWQQSTEKVWSWAPRVVNADREITQVYSPRSPRDNSDTGLVRLHVAQYLEQKQGAEVVNSRNKLFNNQMSRWRVTQKTKQAIVIDEQTIDVTSAVIKGPGWNLLVWYWYRIGSHHTSDSYIAKFREIESRLIDGRRDAAILSVATPVGLGDLEEETVVAEKRLQYFLDELMPELEQSIDQVVGKAE